jgi:hypothetical protein
MELLVALHLIELTILDGSTIHINPHSILSLRAPTRSAEDPKRLVHGKAHCVVSFENGRFIAVLEKCDRVRQLSHEAEGEQERSK